MRSHAEVADAARSLAEVSRRLYLRGWMEGTAGNVSVRLPGSANLALITASGRSKGDLTPSDVVAVDIGTGAAVDPDAPRASAETAIHTALLHIFGDCGAVAHAHPPYATIVSTAAAAAGGQPGFVVFRDFELIKGLGVPDPTEVAVPVFRNWPDVTRIAHDVRHHYSERGRGGPSVLLIEHHGATAWGPTLESARNALECLEALCHLRYLSAMAAIPEESR
jgi:methylthioribulose-1-phosphate dehydratase